MPTVKMKASMGLALAFRIKPINLLRRLQERASAMFALDSQRAGP